MKDDQFTQILRAINDVRDDLKEFKNEMNRRWDENDKRWEENEKELDKIHETINRNHKEMHTTFDAYENSIEKMYQDNKTRITNLEKRLKIASA